MENTNKQIADLEELRELITKAQKKATEMGATSKRTTLARMVDVINFDLFKLKPPSAQQQSNKQRGEESPTS